MTLTKSNRIEKRNGKLTKREIIRKINFRAKIGITSDTYSLSYLARRIELTQAQMRQFLTYLDKINMIKIRFNSEHSVTFI